MNMEQFSKFVIVVLFVNITLIVVINLILFDSGANKFVLKFEHIYQAVCGYFASHFAIELVYRLFKYNDKIINKDLRKGESWDHKLLRQAENLGGALYNLFDIILLYSLFYKTQYWPSEFGGTMNLYNENPNVNLQQTKTAQAYYLFYFGHYIHRLVHHIQSAQGSSTYYQMLLHHLLTPALVFVSIIQNIQKWGFAIFACFAFSNFYLNTSRFVKDSIYPEIIAQVLLVVFIIDWTYKRVYCYNLIVTKAIIIAAPQWSVEQPRLFALSFFQVFFLSIIGILNFYWCIKLYKIAIDKIIFKKKKISYEEGQVVKRK